MGRPFGQQYTKYNAAEARPEFDRTRHTLYAKGGDKREEKLALGRDPLGRRAPAHGHAGGEVGHEEPCVGGLNACKVDDPKEKQKVIRGRDRERSAPILRMQSLLQSLCGRLRIGDGSQVLV